MKKYIKASINSPIAQKIRNIWYDTLYDLGFDEFDVHKFSCSEARNLENHLVKAFQDAGVDLSFKSDIVDLDGIEIKVAGNAQGIASALIRGIIKAGWYPATEFDLESAPNLYEEDRYGYCTPISIDRGYMLLKRETGFTSHGYGSQSYTDEITRGVYEDDEGNIKISISILRWD